MRNQFTKLLLVLSLLASVSLLATPPSTTATPHTPASIAAPADDGGTAEVAVEWITDWPGTGDDRANWYYSANNLYNELGNAGWVKRFNYGNTNAWERDFKAAMYGGINDETIDSVDLALIGTHGSSAYDARYGKVLTSVYFSSNNDDWHLSPGEAYRAYGNNDLEWLAFDSCSVLRDDSMYYWHETFDGLHLMTGFANTMYVVYPGDGGKWGDQMLKKGWWIFGHSAKTVTQAWFSAVEDQQPSGVRARVLAEELNSYNDYIWGQGYVSPDYANNGGYWYWDHVAGTPDPLPLLGGEWPAEMPIIRVVARQVDEDYVQNIGQSFGLTSTILLAPDHSAFYMVGGENDSRQLRVDIPSGGFLYQDLGELWTDPERPRTLPDSWRVASMVAMDFLMAHDDLPGAFDFDPQIPPTIELEGATQGLAEGETKAPLAPTHPTNYAIHYARTIDIGAGQRFSIVGPGSRQNMYIGHENQVVGMKGGWREVVVQQQIEDGQMTAATVPIIDPLEIWTAFLHDPSIALAHTPYATEYIHREDQPLPTLAYYEQTSLLGQAELIPVWVFVYDLYAPAPQNLRQLQGTEAIGLGLVASDVQIYLPASAEANAMPQATILTPLPNIIVRPGMTVDLSGTATGGLAPYSYDWSSSVDGDLGSGATLTGVVLHPDLRGGQLEPNIITLRVIDENGVMATAAVALLVQTPTYLPLIVVAP